MKTIYLIGGEKGGVGKSMLTLSLAELLRKDSALVVDGDESNPDAFKCLHNSKPEGIETVTADLDTQDGWQALIEHMPNCKKPIIVNTPARYRRIAEKYFDYLTTAASDTGYSIKVLWPINRQRDGLIQLGSAMNGYLTGLPVWIVRNLYFGDVEKFVLLESSKIKSQVTGIVDMPDLSDRVTDKIYSDRISFSDAEKFGYAERIAVQRYLKTLSTNLEKVLA